MTCPYSLLLAALAAATVTLPAHAQWSDDPMVNFAIADRPGNQAQPKIAPVSDGTMYVSWFDNATGGFDVYLQKLDANGNELWPHNGVLVADRSFSSTQDYGLSVDGQGNALLAFRDDRSGTVEITAAKVDGDGNLVWGEIGIVLTDTMGAFVAAPKITGVGESDAVVAWTADGGATRAQRLNASGEPQWRMPTSLTDTGGVALSLSDLHAADNGSVIVSMVRGFGGQLIAQKLDADGTPIWAANHVELFSAGGLQFGNFPTFIPDGSGGAVFSWYTTGPLQSFVQHLDTNGNALLTANGLAVATQPGRDRVSPDVDYDPTTGDIYVAWREQIPGPMIQDGIFAQRIDSAGNRVWGANGLAAVPISGFELTQARVEFVDNGQTGAIVTHVRTNSFDNQITNALLVDTAGDEIWNSNVSTVKSGVSRSALSQTDSEQVVMVWSDSRTDENDIYGQNIQISDGALGNDDTPGRVGDLNGDGIVSGADLLMLLNAWGTSGPADLDNSGTVSGADLLILLNNWG